MVEDSTGRHRDPYREITEHIVRAIEAGAPRFEMPWHTASLVNGRPRNAKTNEVYRGINTVSLWATAHVQGYSSPFWATYRQWQELGAQIRVGEKASIAARCSEYHRYAHSERTGKDELTNVTVTDALSLFNAEQVDGWEPTAATPRDLGQVLGNVETFVQLIGAKVFEGTQACYYWQPDYIEMPQRPCVVGLESLRAIERYYATLLHVVAHWTGHPTRLSRFLTGRFGAEASAMEELVAELGGAFLCADHRLANTPRSDHERYLSSWLTVLKRDPKAIFTAAGKASELTGYLEGVARRAGEERAREWAEWTGAAE